MVRSGSFSKHDSIPSNVPGNNLACSLQGPERVQDLYAFRTLIDSGARIAMGSDFPVESMNPLSGFYAAITRLSPSGQSPHGSDGW